MFHTVFPRVIDMGKQLFADYSDEDYAALEKNLARLKNAVMAGANHCAPITDPTKEII